MREHISVIKLLFRGSIYKVIGILAAMTALELIVYVSKIQGGEVQTLEKLLEETGPMIIFGLSFAAVMVIMSLVGGAFGSKTGYTIRRLGISERTFFWWQCGVNAVYLLLLWALQGAILLAACAMYRKAADPAVLSVQTEFIAFHRAEFAHSILPVEEVGLWIRNSVLVFGLAFAGALVPFRHRRGSVNSEVFAMAVGAVICFRQFGLIFALCVTIMVIAAGLWRLYGNEEGY